MKSFFATPMPTAGNLSGLFSICQDISVTITSFYCSAAPINIDSTN
jgi:hypothetical protein